MNVERATGGRRGKVAPLPPARVSVISSVRQADLHKVSLRGRLIFQEAGVIWADVLDQTAQLTRGDRLAFEMSDVERIDGGTMALLVHIRDELAARGVRAEFEGATENVQALIHLYRGDIKPAKRRRRKAEGTIAQVGRATFEFFAELRKILGFLGGSVLAALGILKEPKTGNWKHVIATLERAGADAVPIVMLINFLVGFVMAFQGATQLKQFGANQYVADLVGLSVTRELGPLMTAIILCGRSGASFAAELGSMSVAEEIDALRTMGFGPIRYLVLPRTLALVVALPMLTLVGDLMGILGGLVVGVTSLDLTIGGYMMETQRAVHVWDVFSGVLKSVLFALAISMIACQQGFATTGGAEGVGRRTTASVVSILFSLIVIDAAFTIFLHAFNL